LLNAIFVGFETFEERKQILIGVEGTSAMINIPLKRGTIKTLFILCIDLSEIGEKANMGGSAVTNDRTGFDCMHMTRSHCFVCFMPFMYICTLKPFFRREKQQKNTKAEDSTTSQFTTTTPAL
jgi:hypothetical protein